MKKINFLAGLLVLVTLTGCASTSKLVRGDFKMEELVIKTDSKQIYGNVFKPENLQEKHPLMIFSHGYNGVGSDFAMDGAFFAQYGFVCYSYDFCGGSVRSRSSGKTTEMTIYSEKQDLLDVIDYFSQQDYIDTENIILYGGSQGGFVTALTAAELKEKIKAVILIYPALCIPDNWNDTYKTEEEIPSFLNFWGMPLGRDFFLTARSIDVYNTINGYEGPVYIFHGTNDQIVPLAYSQKAQKIYKNAQLVVMPGEGHGFTPEGSTMVRNYTLKFLRSVLK